MKYGIWMNDMSDVIYMTVMTVPWHVNLFNEGWTRKEKQIYRIIYIYVIWYREFWFMLDGLMYVDFHVFIHVNIIQFLHPSNRLTGSTMCPLWCLFSSSSSSNDNNKHRHLFKIHRIVENTLSSNAVYIYIFLWWW